MSIDIDTSPADGTLLYVPGATEGTVQWKAETLQLVNWGGFEGRTTFELHPGATLISGASGTGKSTLLDAYIALMMPSDTAFNGASNDTGGRARGAHQRNLLSYLRGQTDITTDVDGRKKPMLLRGDGTATWGAVAMTFVNDHGQAFTALRVYLVPAAASTMSDITMRMATYDGRMDLSDLAPLAASAFAPGELKRTFAGLATHETYSAFSDRLFTKLGIGANGDGIKALRLLVRIQAGQQISTVGALYREMVLERPDTFDKADLALGHFDELQGSYDEMLAAQRKLVILEPITAKHDAYAAANATIEQIDTFGLTAPGHSPLVLWALRRKEAVVEDTVAVNRAQATQVGDLLRAARDVAKDAAEDLAQAREEHRAAGGGTLEHLEQQIDGARGTLSAREERLAALAQRTRALDVTFTDAAGFAAAQGEARSFVERYDDEQSALDETIKTIDRQIGPLQQSMGELREDRRSLQGRHGRVDRYLHEMREQVAAAAGFEPHELPFLAELIDVRSDQQQWRTAIESVLGGTARRLLVPLDRLTAFSHAIDTLKLRGRLRYKGVPLHERAVANPDPARVAGKLEYDEDSPYIGWVKAHVSSPQINSLCVQSPGDLDGPGPRVTRSGQQRNGTDGQHGGQGAHIIGFSNADALADLERRIDALEVDITALSDQRAQVVSARKGLEDRRAACEALAAVRFEDVDVWGAERRISELETARSHILESNDQLAALSERVDKLTAAESTAQQQVWALEQQDSDLAKRWQDLTDLKDVVVTDVDTIERAGTVVLTDEQVTQLDAHFTAAIDAEDRDNVDLFDRHMSTLRRRLDTELAAARKTREEMRNDLERIFATYRREVDDPNLGQTVAAYGEYAQILEDIRSRGLHERRAAWREQLTRWSGEDLVPLAQAMEGAIGDIEARLDPINEILRHLKFGATADRLFIHLKRLAPDDVVKFRKTLRTLSSGATRVVGEDEMEKRFADLQRFMNRLRKREDPRATGERNRLLDVRQHVEITAQRRGTSGELLSTYDHLGGKSGGETQELIAFILGAALRFRLGDELRARPRFAPVFLDEGFVKSDSEFAGRAVQAWKGLGFQLIVGAPQDKFTGLEPHMDLMVAITKNTTTHYSFVSHVRGAGTGAAL